MNDEMMKRYQFSKEILLTPLDPINEMLLSGSYQTLIQPVDEINDAITKAVIDIAKENGINEVWLLNKPSILSALEKQIPKKPLKKSIEYNGEYGYCPCCNKVIAYYDSNNVCRQCGQALDWNKE